MTVWVPAPDSLTAPQEVGHLETNCWKPPCPSARGLVDKQFFNWMFDVWEASAGVITMVSPDYSQHVAFPANLATQFLIQIQSAYWFLISSAQIHFPPIQMHSDYLSSWPNHGIFVFFYFGPAKREGSQLGGNPMGSLNFLSRPKIRVRKFSLLCWAGPRWWRAAPSAYQTPSKLSLASSIAEDYLWSNCQPW